MAMECGEVGWLPGFTDELKRHSGFRVMSEERNERIGGEKEETGLMKFFFKIFMQVGKTVRTRGPCVTFSDPRECTWVIRSICNCFPFSSFNQL